MSDRAYTVEEAARLCHCSVWTIYRRIDAGKFESFRAGGGMKIMIPEASLVGFMKKHGIPLPAGLSSGPPKILIVDDDENLLHSLTRHIQAKGQFEVETASSGLGVGMALKSFQPDLILLDIMLGDIDGRELFRALRADPAHEGVKVIAMSGYIEEEDVPHLLEIGFDDYIAKPFEPEDLEARIERIMQTVHGR